VRRQAVPIYMIRLGVVVLALLGALASAAGADTPALEGHVGPGFTITLTANNSPVTQLEPGTYALHVVSEVTEHDFHLQGPNVDLTAGLNNPGSFDFQVPLSAGTYKFFCDFHPGVMKGTFDVGTPPPPPPPPPPPLQVITKLTGSVGPGAKITFARKAPTGDATITIRDRSAKDNFHLRGPGINKKTGVKFKGTVKWSVTLSAGSYTFRSDAHPKLHGTLKVSGQI
jgi:plastocyanin